MASKVKSEFIANMSHELRTPLNTVIGFAKLIGEGKRHHLTSDQVVEYADLIRDAATHLLAVINDILDISKIQSGKYTLDAREVDLAEILRVVLASYRLRATELGVLGQSTSRLEKRADEADRYVSGFLKCTYLKERIGQTFQGLITTVDRKSVV